MAPNDAALDPIMEKLGSVVWDFAGPASRQAIHDLHPYPARFIPQIPRELIRLLHPGDGSAVLDPFCGCGTSIVEAAAADLPAVGVDLNPLAVLITKVKTTAPTQAIEPLARAIASQAPQAFAPIRDIPRVDHWFKRDVQAMLAALTTAIDQQADPIAQDALRLALSRIIVRVSNQDSDTRYAAVEKNIGAADVLGLFVRSAQAVDRALHEAYLGLFPLLPKVTVLHRDVLSLQVNDLPRPIGLVVTSPPYPNAYEYWLYHKYRMYWLGMDPIALRAGEIGARPHYFGKNHQTEDDFQRQMNLVFMLLAKLLPVGRFACFVVGRSKIHGREIDNVQLLQNAASPVGFEFVGSIIRTIARNRKSFNLSHASINEEAIAVFRLGETP